MESLILDDSPQFLEQKQMILPKRSELNPLKVQGLSGISLFNTNFYDIELTSKSLFLYQYVVETDPIIPSDSMKIWYKLVKNIQKTLQKQIGLISHRSNTLWGNKLIEGESLDLIWTSKYKTKCSHDVSDITSNAQSSILLTNISKISNQSQIRSHNRQKQRQNYKTNETQYRVSIRLTNKLDLKNLLTDDKQRGKIIQIINIKIKHKLESLGYIQLGKGKFYQKPNFSQMNLQKIGLHVLRGYKFSLASLKNNKLCLQIDPCTRIIQSQNLHQTIKKLGSSASRQLKGAIVATRYGNFKTYRIDDIDFRKNPNSFFYTHVNRKGKKPGQRAAKIKKTYKQYFKVAYGINLIDDKQPLIRILQKPTKIVKQKKLKQRPNYIYLIPQLLSLTGLLTQQKQNQIAMRAIKPYTKLPPKSRVIQTQKVIHQLQSFDKKMQKDIQKSDLRMIKIKQPTIVSGFQLNPVKIKMRQVSKIQNGQFDIKKPLLNPGKFQNWIFTCSNATSENQIDDFVKKLYQSSKELTIKIKNPQWNFITYKQTDKDFESRKNIWINNLNDQLKIFQNQQEFPQIIVFYLQSFEEKLYPAIKRILINQYGIVSQAVKAKSFQRRQGLSIATGILLQMNQKIGKTSWKVEKNHQQFNKNYYQTFSITKNKQQINHHSEKSESLKSQESFRSSLHYKQSNQKQKIKIKNKKQYKKQYKKSFQKHQNQNSELKKNEAVFKKIESSKKSQIYDSSSVSINSSSFTQSSFLNSSLQKQSLSSQKQSLSFQASSVDGKSLYKNMQADCSNSNNTSNQKSNQNQQLINQIPLKKTISQQIRLFKDQKQQLQQKKQKKQKKDKKQKKEKKEKKQKKLQKRQQKQQKLLQEQPNQLNSNLQNKQQIQNKNKNLKFKQSSDQNLYKIYSQNQSGKIKDQNQKLSSMNQSKEKSSFKEKKQQTKSNNLQRKKSFKIKKDKKSKKKDKIAKKQKSKQKQNVQQKREKYFNRQMKRAQKNKIKQNEIINSIEDLHIASAGFSSSTCTSNGKFTFSFVGTTNKEQTEVYTHSRYGLRRKQNIYHQEFQLIFSQWLKTYYQKSKQVINQEEKFYMPSILIIYREGISQGQLRKQIYKQVRALKSVIKQKVPSSLKYDPQIIYLSVNKRTSARFYDNTTNDLKNAKYGSVIFDQLAKNNTMDFHLISQNVQTQDGTAIPTQYRIVYRNKFYLSQAALAQFTFQQCFNYYNWAGSIKIPAPLQCAYKLSRLVGESIKQNVFKIAKKKRKGEKQLLKITDKVNVDNFLEDSFIQRLQIKSISSMEEDTKNQLLRLQKSIQNNIDSSDFSMLGLNYIEQNSKKQNENMKILPEKMSKKECNKKVKNYQKKPERLKQIVDSFYFL